jgi:hypothetical protein
MANRIIFIVFVFSLLISACSPKPVTTLMSEWRPLLVDKNLSNFTILNGSAKYYVQDEVLIGVSKSNTPNSFLCTNELYSDFILEFEVWADPSLNSGVQFRSNSTPNVLDGRVHGYQMEIESSNRKWAGGIYDEGRRGWLYPLDSVPAAKQAFKVNEWNHYRIEAIENEIITWVNKIQCTHLIDDLTSTGFIGFQIHSIDNENQENKLVKWRNIRIKTKDLSSEKWQINETVPLINMIKNKS